MKTLKRDQKTKENKKNSDSKYSNIVFSQLLTLIDNMFEFGVDSSIIKEIIEPKITYYKLNKSLKDTINDAILSKETQKAIDNEEREKEIKRKEEEKLRQEDKKEENIINDEEKKNGDENKDEKPKKDDKEKKDEGDKKNGGNEDNKEKDEEKKEENKKDETTRQIEKQGWEFMEFEI